MIKALCANIITDFNYQRGGYSFTITLEDGYILHGIFDQFKNRWITATADRDNQPHFTTTTVRHDCTPADQWDGIVLTAAYKLGIDLNLMHITRDGE